MPASIRSHSQSCLHAQEDAKFYADEVHPNDHGQRLLAEMLLEPTLALVTSGAARTVATNRCHRPVDFGKMSAQRWRRVRE